MGTAPVLVLCASRDGYDVAGADLLHWLPPLLHATGARGDDERLAKRVRVPRGPGARLKGDEGARGPPGAGRVDAGSMRAKPAKFSAGSNCGAILVGGMSRSAAAHAIAPANP